MSIQAKTYKALLKLNRFKSIQNITQKINKITYKVKFEQWYHDMLHSDLYSLTDSSKPNIYKHRYKLYNYIVDSYSLKDTPITYIEFGVYKGESMKWWVDNNLNPESTFFGFDTFEGLPEKWGNRLAGTFSTNGNTPEIRDKRVEFVVGMFQDTLPGFFTKNTVKQRTLLHLDADLYSSTLFVLSNCNNILKKGDILLFDEFTDVKHEFRAFTDFASAFNFKYKPIASVNRGEQIAFEVI